jgi:hypothetical protein
LNSDPQAERTEILRRLEQQRSRIDVLLDKPNERSDEIVGTMQNRFPKSVTMRLLISDPIFGEGFNALMVQLLGPRAKEMLKALASSFRAARKLRLEHNSAAREI